MFETAFVHAGPVGIRGQRGEEHARTVLQSGACALDRGGGGLFRLEHDLDVANELIDSLRAQADAEVVRGDLFELVRLVEDHSCGFGQNACVGRVGCLLLDAEVGEEEMVIDDDDLRLERLAAHRW